MPNRKYLYFPYTIYTDAKSFHIVNWFNLSYTYGWDACKCEMKYEWLRINRQRDSYEHRSKTNKQTKQSKQQFWPAVKFISCVLIFFSKFVPILCEIKQIAWFSFSHSKCKYNFCIYHWLYHYTEFLEFCSHSVQFTENIP